MLLFCEEKLDDCSRAAWRVDVTKANEGRVLLDRLRDSARGKSS